MAEELHKASHGAVTRGAVYENRKLFWGVNLTVCRAAELQLQPTVVYLRILFAAGQGKLGTYLLIFVSCIPVSRHFPKMFARGNGHS